MTGCLTLNVQFCQVLDRSQVDPRAGAPNRSECRGSRFQMGQTETEGGTFVQLCGAGDFNTVALQNTMHWRGRIWNTSIAACSLRHVYCQALPGSVVR